MAIPIKYNINERIFDIKHKNKLYIYNILVNGSVSKIISRNVNLAGSKIPVHNITFNNMIQTVNMLATLNHLIQQTTYFDLSNVIYQNIHNHNILNSFAHNMYTTDANTIYINMPFNTYNTYVICANPTSITTLNENVKYIYSCETILPILNTNNSILLRILNLIKILKSSFFLHEYLRTEQIAMPFTVSVNTYFENINTFLEYVSILNIHIEHMQIYTFLHTQSVYEIYEYLCILFGIQNKEFNLPENIDIAHTNHWSEYVATKLPICNAAYVFSTYINMNATLKTDIQPLHIYRNISIEQHINTMLQHEYTIKQLLNSNILYIWQKNNLQAHMQNIHFMHGVPYVKNRLCCICIREYNTSATYIINIENNQIYIKS